MYSNDIFLHSRKKIKSCPICYERNTDKSVIGKECVELQIKVRPSLEIRNWMKYLTAVTKSLDIVKSMSSFGDPSKYVRPNWFRNTQMVFGVCICTSHSITSFISIRDGRMCPS